MPSSKPKKGQTIMATIPAVGIVPAEEAKAIVYDVDKTDLLICVFLEPSYRGKLFTRIKADAVIEIVTSVPTMGQKDLDDKVHGTTLPEKK